MKFRIVIIFLLLSGSILAQCDNFKMFEHFKIEDKYDTVNYHVYAPGGLTSKKNILFFIHGSNSRPFYEFFEKDGKKFRGSSVPFNLKSIPDSYAFVIISKKGVVFCHDEKKEFEPSDEYFDNLSLKYRAQQVDRVIRDITLNHLVSPKKVVVIGHSEGSDVVAKLGTINKQITNIGFWSGSGNSQLYDFPLFIRKEVLAGKLTEEEGLEEIESLFNKYKDIMKNKEDLTKSWYGHPYKRWANFSEPPIENLLQISIPLYVAMGAKDTSVPVESTYLIPVEFIRNSKENLTFKVYPNLDHSFNEKLKDGSIKRNWNKVFSEFMEWVSLN
ncbi:Dienelactone hydrolase family protein [Tenacibaculum sp. 190524A05c]